MNLVHDMLIKKSTLVAQYNETLGAAKSRFEADTEAGLLAGKDESQRANHYLKLAVEEVRKLKERIENGVLQEESDYDIGDEKDACLAGAGDYDPDEMVQNWNPNEQDNDDLEKSLFADLVELERQAAADHEMGRFMETIASFNARTRWVLADLLNNEACQLASAILANYMTGGGSSIATLVLPRVSGLQFKLIEYLMNAATDVISVVMGKKTRIIPSD